MGDTENPNGQVPKARSAGPRLDGWGEIAAYLRRNERTVRRWETLEGLPVHRHMHNRQPSIYAFADELDAWWANGRARLETEKENRGAASFYRSGWMIAAVVVVSAAIAAAGIFFWPSPPVTEGDFILLADFVNRTGDDIFDGTLRAGLAVKLGESPYLRIISEQQVRKTLNHMQRSADEPVTGEVAREVCQRVNAKAMLTGEIAPLGENYVITLTAVGCADGETVAREQVEADSKENVLDALDRSSSSMRHKLGESLASIERFDTPLFQADTSSLEALKAWNQGMRVGFFEARYEEAIPFMRRAIDLDPEFGMAYSSLYAMHSLTGQENRGRQYLIRAYELRHRINERSRLAVILPYHRFVTGEIDKAIETGLMYKKIYPRAAVASNILFTSYTHIGEYERALEHTLKTVELYPDHNMYARTLFHSYEHLNRYAEARRLAEPLIEQGRDVRFFRGRLLRLALIEGDDEAAKRHSAWLEENARGVLLDVRASEALVSGRFREFRKFQQSRIDRLRRLGRNEAVANLHALIALMHALQENIERARSGAEAALKLDSTMGLKLLAGTALARAGETDRAEEVADEAAAEYPTFTLLNERDLPALRALIALNRDDPERAIEVLQPALRFGLRAWEANYIRGRAFLELGEGEKAAAEFRKMLDHRGVLAFSLLYPLNYVGLARAKALAGDIAGARQTYEEFFELWEDADPDIPILLEAQAEYAKLK